MWSHTVQIALRGSENVRRRILGLWQVRGRIPMVVTPTSQLMELARC